MRTGGNKTQERSLSKATNQTCLSRNFARSNATAGDDGAFERDTSNSCSSSADKISLAIFLLRDYGKNISDHCRSNTAFTFGFSSVISDRINKFRQCGCSARRRRALCCASKKDCVVETVLRSCSHASLVCMLKWIHFPSQIYSH